MQNRHNDEISLELIKLYVKKGCKKCLGRGYLVWEATGGPRPIRTGEPMMRYADYCSCVQKGIDNASETFIES